jgi:hypothetical protein
VYAASTPHPAPSWALRSARASTAHRGR